MTASVTVRSMDLDGLARGMLTIVGGRAPAAPGEVAVSRPVADLAGVGIDDAITLAGMGKQRVVGLVEDPFNLQSRQVLADPSLARSADPTFMPWLVKVPAGIDPTSIDFSTAAVNHVGFRGGSGSPADQASPAIIVLGGLAMVEAALVAAAAFAVSVRRRQHELGLLAAAGAAPRHLAGSVLAEALLLGLLGLSAASLSAIRRRPGLYTVARPAHRSAD